MDKFVYTAMNGAKQVMLRQAGNAHNLANVDTVGFRADIDRLSALPVYGPGAPTRVMAQDERAGVSFAQGKLMHTDRPLDAAINGEGFFAVQAPDGAEAYTRGGSFRVSDTGILETSAGHPVLGDGGPISLPPFSRIQLGADGTISILPLGQNGNTLSAVDRLKLVRPDVRELEKLPEGLLRLRDGGELPADAAVQVSPGTLEGSNVNVVESLVNMIELARLFEINVKLMREAESNDSAAAELMRMG